MQMCLRPRQHSTLLSHGVQTDCLLLSLKGDSVLSILLDQFLTMLLLFLLTGPVLITNILSPSCSLITLNGGGVFTNLLQDLIAQVVSPIPCETGEGNDSSHSGQQNCHLALHQWGYYRWSIVGDVESVLLFDLADRMCVQFRTCGTTATLDSGTSFVNNAVVSEFQNGQKHVLKRNCDRVRKSKDRIVKLMAIPLVQATLHMAYQQSFAPQATEERVLIDEVKGAAYAATVLPLVHDCGKKDAASIYENLKYKNGEMRDVVDFSAVKDAFERNYECMGITCEEVGGIWTKDGYSEFALPCNGASSKFYFTTLVCVLILSCFLFVRFRMQEGIDRNFERDSPNFPGIFQRNTRSFD